MHSIYSRVLTVFVSLSFLALAGCSAPPVLITKSAAVPVGTNLTGSWRLREDPNSRRQVPAVGSNEPLTIMKSPDRRQRSRRQKTSSGISAHVFLEFGDNLKITQTEHGLFISYDRSIVEEYTFGENRIMHIGPVEAIRVSGWEDSSFVVETLDDDGNTLFETWHLKNDDSLLVRDIRISKGDEDSFTHQQEFERK